MSKENSVVGDLINFRGLVYSPMNENGVIYLFGKVTQDLHIYIEEIKPGFPDCIGRRFTGKGWERIRIEFEYKSSHFKQHGHDPEECDVIVCWEHDWKDCPIEVVELRSAVQDMENIPIKRPGTAQGEPDYEKTIDALFERAESQSGPREWWEKVQKVLQSHDEEIWFNIGRVYLGIYSPERSFAAMRPTKTALVFDCFTRGEPLEGLKKCGTDSPRWGRFPVKQESDIDFATKTLLDALSKLKAAMKAGEPTGFFSGGPGTGKKPSEEDLEKNQNETN